MKQFIVYEIATGKFLRAGNCQDDALDQQVEGRPGEAVMEATRDLIVVAEMNLDPVRVTLCAKIDAEAESVRGRYITPGSGQAMTYLAKQAEAAAFLADPSVKTPFLTAEADATETTVADLAAVVAQNAAAWAVIGAKIEGVRRCAKIAVEAADNIAVMHAASQIDWAAALA